MPWAASPNLANFNQYGAFQPYRSDRSRHSRKALPDKSRPTLPFFPVFCMGSPSHNRGDEGAAEGQLRAKEKF